MSIRRKTHVEALIDGTIDTENVFELVGFYYPEYEGDELNGFEVVCAEEGTYFTAKNETEAKIIATLEEIKHMLVRLLQKQ
ncbi:MAG: hypothetical protein DRN95_02700 [Candidatus Hydrothermarchaeota archaeon]|nr:MAG: hypothetical protein DRN95_02700 [Candidatus Hydrothermarchaeota archaeon]